MAMARANGSDRPDPAKGQSAALGELRASVLWGMGLFFALVMAVVAISVTVGGMNDGSLLLRLGLMALTLPLAMAALVRRILAPAAELQRMSEQLRTLYSQARLDALLDPITGLGNHRAFQEELHRQIEDAGRHDHHVALAIVDLDDLKRVNDEHGHVGGDQLLASMGQLLVGASRVADRAFRIGGDEFALILPHADAGDAHAVIRRVLSSALSAETAFGRPYSFSAGVSAYPLPSQDGGRLLRNADAALYWAKRHGRTDVQVYDPDRHGVSDDTRSTPELVQAIDQITGQRAIVPLFQPIFDLDSGQPVGFEGLVRPREGAAFRDATALFAAAEVADRTVELDLLAIDVIAAAVGGGLGEGYLSFNLSPRTLEADQFRVSELISILRNHGLEPGRVVLELTEREAVEDMERLRKNLHACRVVGFRIAADDVGAGNAGLRLLSEIDFDIVKIDLSLVRGGAMRESALAVLSAIQDIAARADATVIAEGIETVDQLDVIREVGISRGQGFLLANTATEPEADTIDIERLLDSHRARRRALLGTWGAAIKG
jgi:diguanylate cyclase (GGDEF)-like protein